MAVDLLKLQEEIKALMKNAGARDHGTYVNELLKIQEQIDSRGEDVWWAKLKQLKEASESIEELQFDDPKRYKMIFDNGKKNEVFLME